MTKKNTNSSMSRYILCYESTRPCHTCEDNGVMCLEQSEEEEIIPYKLYNYRGLPMTYNNNNRHSDKE